MNTLLLLCVVTTLNWQANIPENGMKYEIADNGAITLHLTGRGPHSGGDGILRAKVPLYAKGTLDFDMRSTRPATGFGMGGFLSLYGIQVFWHDACGDWRVYQSDTIWNREEGFDDEPSRHVRIAKFKNAKWHHCRIRFDHLGDRVEFFMDDMSDPAYISGERSVWGTAEFMGGEIAVGGMGYSRDGVVEFKNIQLDGRRLIVEGENAGKVEGEGVGVGEGEGVERTETLVFEGPVNEYYEVPKRLKGEKLRIYSLDSTRPTIFPVNEFKYSSMPGETTFAKAKRIILVDAPAQPKNLLPKFILRDIAKAVEEGAELIVLDGPFALSKGGYLGTALERILPKAAMPEKQFERFDKPEIIEGTAGKGKVKVFRGLKFTSDPTVFHPQFDPWAAQLF